MATNTHTETNTHQPTVKPRLPKYDSQSETTNDLPLIENHNKPDTEIEKHRNTKPRLPTPTHTLTILNKDKTKEIKVRT